ncbi:MAG: CsbD family protein [Candidatus Binatia bacterium]
MNWDQIEGKWDNFKGKVRERWGKLTDDELDQIAGKRDQLLGKLKEKYGTQKEAAQKELDDFLRRL